MVSREKSWKGWLSFIIEVANLTKKFFLYLNLQERVRFIFRAASHTSFELQMYDIQLKVFDSRIIAKKWRLRIYGIYCKFSLLFLIAERGWLCVVEIARRLPLCELATASSKTKLYCETIGTKICISLYLSLSLLKRNCGICLWCSVTLHPETKEQDLNKNRLLAAARCIRRQEQGGGGGQQGKRNGKRRSFFFLVFSWGRWSTGKKKWGAEVVVREVDT